MPLTQREEAFVASLVYEFDNRPREEPARIMMQERGISIRDIRWILFYYVRPRMGQDKSQTTEHCLTTPECPWDTRYKAVFRNRVLLHEVQELWGYPEVDDEGLNQPRARLRIFNPTPLDHRPTSFRL